MAMSSGSPAEINVTPLIDVVLVLLVIFMVITPMMNTKSGVELPLADRPEERGESDVALVASVDRDGTLRVGDAVVDAAAATTQFRAAVERGMADRVTLEADRSLRFGDLRPLITASAAAGLREAAFAVQRTQEVKP